MKIRFYLLIFTGVLCFWLLSSPVWAAPTGSQPETVAVRLGTAGGSLKFEPNQLTLSAGQKYKLALDNPSPEKHYFTAKDFADASWTQKVEAGRVEIKGAVHELELKPGAQADWVLAPMKPGTYELYCSIPGHRKAGMTGTITIQAP